MRKLGGCIVCDRIVFEIVEKWTAPHPLAGDAKRVGKPLDNAVRVALILSSGRTALVTVCDECAAKDLPFRHMWQRAQEREMWEHENREAMGGQEQKPDVKKKITADILSRADDVPLGVLGQIPWSEA